MKSFMSQSLLATIKINTEGNCSVRCRQEQGSNVFFGYGTLPNVTIFCHLKITETREQG